MSSGQPCAESLAQGLGFLDGWLRQRHEDLGWPGMAMAVSLHGEPVFATAYGHANTNTGEPLSPRHSIHAASQTKTFTATVIKLLEQEGVLNTNQYLSDFVPEITTHRDSRWRRITIESLLSNGAGITRDGADSDFWEFHRPFPNKESLVDTLLNSELVIDPDTQMKYSNLGFAALGLVINRATMQTYREVVTQRIIEPLGLISTHFGNGDAVSLAQGYGRPHGVDGRTVMPHVDVGAYDSATGLYSSVVDLSRFYGTLVPDGTDRSLLSKAARVDMQTPRWEVKNGHDVQYGLGMDIGLVGGRRMAGHGGGYPGYMSKTLTDSQEGLTVSGVATCIDGDGLMMTIGVMEALDFFARHAGPTYYPLEHFNAKLKGMWGDRQIVVAGNHIVSIDPHGWHPFADAEVLERIDSDTLRVVRANGFDAEQELVHFQANTVRYCGRSMVRADTNQVIGL